MEIFSLIIFSVLMPFYIQAVHTEEADALVSTIRRICTVLEQNSSSVKIATAFKNYTDDLDGANCHLLKHLGHTLRCCTRTPFYKCTGMTTHHSEEAPWRFDSYVESKIQLNATNRLIRPYFKDAIVDYKRCFRKYNDDCEERFTKAGISHGRLLFHIKMYMMAVLPHSSRILTDLYELKKELPRRIPFEYNGDLKKMNELCDQIDTEVEMAITDEDIRSYAHELIALLRHSTSLYMVEAYMFSNIQRQRYNFMRYFDSLVDMARSSLSKRLNATGPCPYAYFRILLSDNQIVSELNGILQSLVFQWSNGYCIAHVLREIRS